MTTPFNPMRGFGLEIEFYHDDKRCDLAQMLTDAGLHTESEGYNHRTQGFWKLVPDASLSNSDDDDRPNCDYCDCDYDLPCGWEQSDLDACRHHHNCERFGQSGYECELADDGDGGIVPLEDRDCEQCTREYREYEYCDDCRDDAREDYCDNCRDNWEGNEGSTGSELVSPILWTPEGLKEDLAIIREVFGQVAHEVFVNRDCGLHVHHGARDLSLWDWKRLFLKYAQYEEAIDGIMPESRRGSNNGHCASLLGGWERTLDEAIRTMTKINDMSKMQRAYGTRYVKLNAESFVTHGTVEFRHHNGTIDPEKILNWVIFTQAMVEQSVQPNTPNFQYNPKEMGTLNTLLLELDLPWEVQHFYRDRKRWFGGDRWNSDREFEEEVA
jgi:hypothetical protein